MNRHHPGRRLLDKAKQGAHILERGLAIYHGIRRAVATGSAIASAAAPYMAAGAAIL